MTQDGVSIYDAEDIKLRDIVKNDRATAVRITATMDELYEARDEPEFCSGYRRRGNIHRNSYQKNIIKYFVASRTGKKFTAPLKSKFISGKPKSVSE